MAKNVLGHDLKHTVLERLMHYYHFVGEQLENGQGATVTSTQIAELLHMDATLVRKDLAAIGVRGIPRVGFNAREVLGTIREILGFEEVSRGVILGAGRLGGAMASYHGFARYGLKICALFDCEPTKIGTGWAGYVVQPLENLPQVVREEQIDLAILTVPAEAAQSVATFAIDAGVKVLWNFANTNIHVPEEVFVRHEHISVGLAELSYRLKRHRRSTHHA